MLTNGSERMPNSNSFLSHTAVAGVAAVAAGFVTYLVMADRTFVLAPSAAHAQQATGQKTTDVITQAMTDLGREMRIRLTEREPGNGSPPHRHPGHHTFGYVLEGTYEVKVGDGPVRQLKAGEAFYEPPGALHAVSRNPSPDKVLKYLIIQVADPSKPTIVPE
jgi:quercetin dioxygenase-like cupin family protein